MLDKINLKKEEVNQMMAVGDVALQIIEQCKEALDRKMRLCPGRSFEFFPWDLFDVVSGISSRLNGNREILIGRNKDIIEEVVEEFSPVVEGRITEMEIDVEVFADIFLTCGQTTVDNLAQEFQATWQ